MTKREINESIDYVTQTQLLWEELFLSQPHEIIQVAKDCSVVMAMT